MSKIYKHERKQSNKTENTRHYMLLSQTPPKAKRIGGGQGKLSEQISERKWKSKLKEQKMHKILELYNGWERVRASIDVHNFQILFKTCKLNVSDVTDPYSVKPSSTVTLSPVPNFLPTP